MNGLRILFLLIILSALPVFLVGIWFRASKYPLGPRWFLLSLLSGVISLFPAALLQSFFSRQDGVLLGSLLFKIFVQIALTEEAGRLLVLFALFWLWRRRGKRPDPPAPSFWAATGLLSGLGFAVVETASYGAVNLGLALLRAFTAAPLHGACGARVGLTAASLKTEPVRAVLRFLSAVALHGMYNFMILSPGLPAIFSVFIAFSALASSLLAIRSGAPPRENSLSHRPGPE
ncbi:MAG: PrsW family intramembrane metalloprotease [Spirochaetaceae bacterium]|jgi:RsiW-degrading membrane proteinase PrsW (M82 family)|nr:PrsW family intramembrane metalloprotease [Spirochaetaceae bacterium]